MTTTIELPVKLNDDYTCQGRDRNGAPVVFDDLLDEGDLVATVTDSDGNTFGPHGVVVRKDDGLWIDPAPRPACPDGGACHHSCGHECFRVWCCEPLSNVYPDDRWPADAKPVREPAPSAS